MIFEVDNSGSALFQYLLGSECSIDIIDTTYEAGVVTLTRGHIEKDQNVRTQRHPFCSQGRMLVHLVLISACPSPFGTTVGTSLYSFRSWISYPQYFLVGCVGGYQKTTQESRVNMYKCFEGTNVVSFLILRESLPNLSIDAKCSL